MAVLLLLGSGASIAATTIWYQRVNGSIGRFDMPSSTITATLGSTASTVGILGSDPSTGLSLSATLNAPPDQALAPGSYESAQRTPQDAFPGLQLFFSDSSICPTVTGRFVVLELVVDSNSNVLSFAADIEHHCGGGATPSYVEIRYNSAVPLTVDKAPGATSPDAFAFAPQSLLLPGATATSDSTAIYGINAPADISVTGGEYSVNGGAFTSATGVVANRDEVRVRTVASSSGGATIGATLTVGGVSATFNVTTYATGAPFTAIYWQSTPGDYIGLGLTVEGTAPAWSITASRPQADSVVLSMDGFGGVDSFSLYLGAVSGATLTTGPYESATRYEFRGNGTGVDFYGDGRGCGTVSGRFVVLDADFGPGTQVNRFAADFEQSCDGRTPLYGEVRYNSAVPLSTMKPAGTTLPDPFAFASQGPVQPGSTATSNSVTLYGVNAPVPISISGGEYSLNEAPYTTVAGTAHNTDHVVVRVKASTSAGGTSSATFNAGGRLATFTAVTYQPGSQLTGLSFQSTSGDFIGGGATRTFMSPTDQLTATRNIDNAISLALNGALGDLYNLDLSGPDNAPLAVGTYENAQRYPFQGTAAGLSFYGDGKGCNQVAGRFTVREVQYGTDGAVQRFAADFEHHCESLSAPPLYGEVRYNSTIPFSYLVAPASLTSPTAGTVLASPTQTFQWTDAGATLYQVWVGSSPGAYDYGYFPTTGTRSLSTNVSGIPIDGRTVYVRLWSNVLGTYRYNDYSFATAAPTPASITNPAPGATLTGATQLFAWNAAPGATLYQLWIGNTLGANDLGYFPRNGTALTSATATSLPTDGRLLYVRLYSNIGGTYYYRDFTYHAYTAPVLSPAQISSPAPGSTLAGSSVSFTWNDAGASLYQLWVGSSAGAHDFGYFPSNGTTSTSATATGLPMDGRTLYVRLYSAINGAYQFRDYTYTAAGSGGSGGSSPTAAVLATPAPGSQLSGASATFTWNNSGATLYQLWVGSSAGAYDVGYFPAAGTTSTSTSATGLPSDGRVLYVRLYSLVNGAYQYHDYTYTAAGSGGSGGSSPSAASLLNPTPGGQLSGSSVTFTWSNSGASLYQLWVGTSPGADDLGYFPAAGTTGTSVTATGLPTNGRTVYVRLYSLVNGAYQYHDYSYVTGP